MELTLYTENYFDAAHFIRDYDGKCAHIHGHTWKVCVWVRGKKKDIAPNGIMWDFGNLKEVIRKFDHSQLNDVLSVNPTSENIALYLYREMKKGRPELLFKVRLYENTTSRQSYCETGDFEGVT
ncbi:MAG: 6-carboxytetrahydropterin synthase [Spirochaetales bacterium]|nr:6-carboxytetrahydropterin synthase [Spirochaetales bacterium]